MKQQINPGVAIVIILAVVGVAGYFLWKTSQIGPRPEHVGLPAYLQKMEEGRKDSFKKKPGPPEKPGAAKPESGKPTPDAQGGKDEKKPAASGG